MQMPTTKQKSPAELSEDLLALLRVYAEMEQELGRGPSLRELLPRTGYADHSGVAHAVKKLAEQDLIRPRKVDPGGLTADGRALLKTGKRKIAR